MNAGTSLKKACARCGVACVHRASCGVRACTVSSGCACPRCTMLLLHHPAFGTIYLQSTTSSSSSTISSQYFFSYLGVPPHPPPAALSVVVSAPSSDHLLLLLVIGLLLVIRLFDPCRVLFTRSVEGMACVTRAPPRPPHVFLFGLLCTYVRILSFHRPVHPFAEHCGGNCCCADQEEERARPFRALLLVTARCYIPQQMRMS